MVMFSLARDLGMAYGARALAGAFAAAVVPVSLAQAAEYDETIPRARRFAWLSAAATVGFLAGPMLSGWLAGIPMVVPQSEMRLGGPVAWPFMVTAVLAAGVWVMAYRHVPGGVTRRQPAAGHHSQARMGRGTGGLMVLTLLAMLGLGAFEVGLSLQGRQAAGLDPFRIGLLFTECSLAMLVAQILWSTHPPKTIPAGYWMAGAFLVMALGIAGLPYVANFWWAVVVVGLLGTGSGILIPLLAYEVSLVGGVGQGAALGMQTAVSSFGQAVGSVAAGVLFDGGGLIAYWMLAMLLLAAAGWGSFWSETAAGGAE